MVSLSRENKAVDIFVQLGLTSLQAQAYLTIFKLIQPNASSISKNLNVARSEVYRVTGELQELGLVHKFLTNPFSFRAISLSDAVTLLLKQKESKYTKIRAKAEQFLPNYEISIREKNSQEAHKYLLTKGLRAEEFLFLKELAEAQTSMDCLLEWKIVDDVFAKFLEELEEALGRGVNFRYITYIPENKRTLSNFIRLTGNSSFEVRFCSKKIEGGFDIVDKRLLRFINLPNSNVKEIEVLRSNHASAIDFAQEYFNLKWDYLAKKTEI
jgi:sugar-specific transcriptional regulator TrmB